MMQVIYAIISISLAVLLTYGGLNYMNTETPVRAVMSRGVYAQYEAIVSGVASYRLENHGISPSTLDDFEGYLPHGEIPKFGIASQAFSWSVQPDAAGGAVKTDVCLHIENARPATLASAATFTDDLKRRSGIVPLFGDACGSGLSGDGHGQFTVITMKGV